MPKKNIKNNVSIEFLRKETIKKIFVTYNLSVTDFSNEHAANLSMKSATLKSYLSSGSISIVGLNKIRSYIGLPLITKKVVITRNVNYFV